MRAVHGLALVAVLAAGILAAALWPSRSGPPSVPVAIAAVQPQRAPVVMTLAAKAVPETAMTVAEAAPKAGPARAAAAPRRKVSPPARTRRVSTQSGPSVKRSALARRDPCAALGGLDRSRCLYPVVLAADQRLRSAYADAAREGASRSTLASYRKDWLRLRRRANSEPDRVIEGYLAMARELGSLAAGPDPRGRS